jgi:hypothetical protein
MARHQGEQRCPTRQAQGVKKFSTAKARLGRNSVLAYCAVWRSLPYCEISAPLFPLPARNVLHESIRDLSYMALRKVNEVGQTIGVIAWQAGLISSPSTCSSATPMTCSSALSNSSGPGCGMSGQRGPSISTPGSCYRISCIVCGSYRLMTMILRTAGG